MKKSSMILLFVLGIPATLFVLLLIVSSMPEDPEARKKSDREKAETCAKAMMSSMGTSTYGYLDKQAYEKEVAEKCPFMSK